MYISINIYAKFGVRSSNIQFKLSEFACSSLLIRHIVFSLALPNKQSSIPCITPENFHFNLGIERAVICEQD